MVYEEDRETSAGLLRLAVQRMGQHAAALTPICYTVWYEYLAGINPRLTQSMDSRLKEGALLDDTAIVDLYRRYCSEFNIEMQQNIRETSQQILGNIRQQAEEARLHANEFGRQLEQSASSLTLQNDGEALCNIIRASKNEDIGGITISIGVATLEENEDPSVFFDRADQALYASKGNGRNQVTMAQF